MTREAQNSIRQFLRRHHEVILLGAILLAALALRLYQLEQDSFWIDELTQIRRSRLPFSSMIKDVLAEVSAVPIEYIITHFVYYYVGRSEGILRLPAVLWGVLSVATLYFLGKRMFDKTTGFLAAAILTILPSHIYYSQEVRVYSLAAFMVLLTTFTFHRALERNTRGAWVLYGATLAVGMYAHYYVAIVGILHGAYLVLMALAKRLPWNRLLPYVVAAGIAGLLFLPWVLADQFRSGYSFQWPSWSTLLSAPFVPRGGGALRVNFRPLSLFVGFAWACALAGIVIAIRGGDTKRENLGLLAVVALAGMASVLVLDYTAPYFFANRQFLPYAPILVLLVAAGALGTVRAVAGRLARAETRDVIATVAAVLVVAFAAATLAGSRSDAYRHKKQDWRGVGRYLLQHVEKDDAVLLRATFDIEFYAPELKSQIIRLRNLNTLKQAARTHRRVWIVDWSSALGRYVPDVAKWVATEKPLRVPGFTAMEVYIYSEQMTREQLEASLKQW